MCFEYTSGAVILSNNSVECDSLMIATIKINHCADHRAHFPGKVAVLLLSTILIYICGGYEHAICFVVCSSASLALSAVIIKRRLEYTSA